MQVDIILKFLLLTFETCIYFYKLYVFCNWLLIIDWNIIVLRSLAITMVEVFYSTTFYLM